MGFVARASLDPTRRGRSRSEELRRPPHEPLQVDLTVLSQADLTTLLRNLRSTDRRALVEAVEAELRTRGLAARAVASGAPLPPSRRARDEADPPGAARLPSKRQAALALAALGACAVVVAVAPVFRDRPAPDYRASAPAPPPRVASAPAVNADALQPPRGTPEASGGAAVTAARARAPAAVAATTRREAVQAATASSDADALVAQPTFLEIAQAAPPPPVKVAPPAAPEAAAPTGDRPSAPLLTRRAQADLLGSPNPGANPLKGLQSSSPLRMATAITAAAQ